MPKLIIVSNRLPVTVKSLGGEFFLEPSAGGLATGLAPLMQDDGPIWIGWPGALPETDDPGLQRLRVELKRRRLYPVTLDSDEVDGYYNGFSNGALWPLYHYQAERMPLALSGWEAYVGVNERFADAVAKEYEVGDLIWVHDYHLQLVPRLLRERLPEARIGFFLHIPFPSSEIFRILPWRAEILEGLLGSDLIGFHTHAYARHFRSALLRILGIDAYADSVEFGGRTIKISAFPLGVDGRQVGSIEERPVEAELEEALAGLKSSGRIDHLLLAIDRLDYTKGIPRRLLALERMLQTTPDLRGRIALIQIAVPSRDDVPAYLESRRTVEELVGRINGQFGQPGHQPIHYVTRPFTQEQVFALYRLVDVMVVTPLRDGMNLVAKEFVASRHDESGVLVLSEFAGAAAELGEAVQVNPYDIDGTAEGLRVAITMGASERSARMKALRARVAQFDATSWTRGFLDILRRPADAAEKLTFIRAGALAEHVPRDRRLVLFLDYDGTLYPIVRIPQLAAPDKALLALLERLAKYERCEVHIVSGRPGSVMEAWFGHLRLHLHAEHGAMSKAPSANDWQVSVQRSGASNWQSFVRPVLEEVVRNTPGSFIEEKVHSLAWHYRMADPVHADRTANELRLHGRETFAPLGVELITGKRVIEVRQVGANKGSVIGRVLETIGDSPFAVAIGDDTTDEDMFMAVSGRGIGIVVGDRPSKAEARLRDHAEVRRFLELIAAPGEARA